MGHRNTGNRILFLSGKFGGSPCTEFALGSRNGRRRRNLGTALHPQTVARLCLGCDHDVEFVLVATPAGTDAGELGSITPGGIGCHVATLEACRPDATGLSETLTKPVGQRNVVWIVAVGKARADSDVLVLAICDHAAGPR